MLLTACLIPLVLLTLVVIFLAINGVRDAARVSIAANGGLLCRGGPGMVASSCCESCLLR